MDNGHELGVCASQTAQRRGLSRPEGGDDNTDAVDSGIPICRVRRNEFIWAAFPAKAGLEDEVQERKFVILRSVNQGVL